MATTMAQKQRRRRWQERKRKASQFFYQDRADSTELTEESLTGAQEAEPSQETKSEP
jgi:hypothetical protein